MAVRAVDHQPFAEGPLDDGFASYAQLDASHQAATPNLADAGHGHLQPPELLMKIIAAPADGRQQALCLVQKRNRRATSQRASTESCTVHAGLHGGGGRAAEDRRAQRQSSA